MTQVERFIKSGIPDFLDNVQRQFEPEVVEQDSYANEKMLERLLPQEAREQLLALSENFERGQDYRAVILVGKKENGTLHPHLFVIQRTEKGIELFFVDPEHNVGKHNLLRPKIENLITMKVPQGSEAHSELAILRFRTNNIKDVTLLKLQPQLEAARTLIDNDGVPQILQEYKNDITLRIVIKEGKTITQSRYTSKKELESFLAGKQGSFALEGKVQSQQAILKRFVEYLQEDKFKKKETPGEEKLRTQG